MKRLYLLLNAILLAAILLLIWANLRYESPAADKAVHNLPQLPVLSPLPAVPLQLTSQDTIRMAEQNVFSPGRGKAVTGNAPGAAEVRSQLQLVGICMIGKNYGAIIVGKNGNWSPRPVMAGPNGAPTHQPVPTTGNGGKVHHEKRFFKLGEVVDGLILKEIKTDAVILVGNHDRIELKLERGNHGDKNKAVAGQGKPRPGMPPMVSQVQVLQHYDSLMNGKPMR